MAIYSPADIAKLLKVKEPTVRKYSLLLEEVGYKFKRNVSGQRWYEDKDVVALQKLVTFKHNGDMKLKDAAEAVFHWSKGENVTDSLPVTRNDITRDTDDITHVINSDIKAVTELLEAQERRFMQALLEMKEQQQKRDKVLLDTISALSQLVQDQQERLNAPTTDLEKLEAAEQQPQQPEKEKGLKWWQRIRNK